MSYLLGVRYFSIILSIALVSVNAADRQCYYRDGSKTEDQPCLGDDSTETSPCCGTDGWCTENKRAYVPKGALLNVSLCVCASLFEVGSNGSSFLH